MTTLKLMNPHSVLATLQARPSDVLEVHVSRSKSNEAWKQVATEASELGIPVREPLQRTNQRQREDGGRIGTTFAVIKPKAASSLDDLFSDPSPRGVWLMLDHLQDPHNVGAVFRTAGFFGIKGVILTQDKSAPLTATVYDVAAGGMEAVPHVIQTNLVRAIQQAKKQDMWVLGSSEHADLPLAEIDVDRRWLLIVGSEEKGLRRLTLENCDQVCQIPPAGPVTSLNVSVATGIMIATLSR